MELQNEMDAEYIVRHTATEKKLLHLERGVRKLGYQSRGNKIVLGCLALGAACLSVSAVFEGAVAGTLLAVGLLGLLAFVFFLYSLLKGWKDAEREIHLQFENGKGTGEDQWEYRFYGTCYEVAGKNEVSRAQYSHIGRLMEISGMYAFFEKGNLIRYFDKADVTKGDADELASFLEQKCRMRMEFIKVRS